MTPASAAARDRIERICASGLDPRALRVRVIAELRRAVGFEAYAWLLTDPQTWVGAAPLAHIPDLADLPRLIRAKYLTEVNRWTGLPRDAAVTLAQATDGRLSRSRLWRELLQGYGVVDVASMVFRDAYGCWGFLDLWRGEARGPFAARERDLLTGLVPLLTTALRTGVAATFVPAVDAGGADPPADPPAGLQPPGPVVLMLSAGLDLLAQTPPTDAYLRALLPPDGDAAPVPAAAYNVAAQLLAVEQGVDGHPAAARVHLGRGRWLTLRAARLPGPDAAVDPSGSAIAVSIEPTRPADRAGLFARAGGLSGRETELMEHLLTGLDTRGLAERMVLSEHTVQDHLKSIFAKTGTTSRRALVARALGT